MRRLFSPDFFHPSEAKKVRREKWGEKSEARKVERENWGDKSEARKVGEKSGA